VFGVHATATASCQPGGVPGGRGTRKDGQQRGGEQREDVGVTRGGEGKQEVSRGSAAAGGTMAAGAALYADCREEQQGCQRKKKRGGVPGDWFANYKNPRGLSVNHNFL
jgi:hypothetical protein